MTIVDLSMHFATFLSTASFLSREHELDLKLTIDGIDDMPLDGLEDIALLTALFITAIKFQSKLYMYFNQLKKLPFSRFARLLSLELLNSLLESLAGAVKGRSSQPINSDTSLNGQSNKIPLLFVLVTSIAL